MSRGTATPSSQSAPSPPRRDDAAANIPARPGAVFHLALARYIPYMPMFVSIDQNSHVLWDTVPKLAALLRHGFAGTHCIEDIDVAFTRQGGTGGRASCPAQAAKERPTLNAQRSTFKPASTSEDGTAGVPPGGDLELAPECYYRSGNSDWGAALFYTEFLGRNALNPRDLEPYTGLTTASLARKLNLGVDEFYARHAGSDNWQLTGSSYAGDAQHHRVIGDLSVAETAPFVRRLLERALADLEHRFPDAAARERVRAWYAAESATAERLLAGMPEAHLTDFYAAWLRNSLPDAKLQISLTSDLMRPNPDSPRLQLLRLFLADYPVWSGHYNAAIAETACGLKPLDTAAGELPFFAVFATPGAPSPNTQHATRNGQRRLSRTALTLSPGGRLVAGDLAWPAALPFPELLEKMRANGLVCISGKALLLVLQARLKPDGAPLALPHLGSLYMPAARAFERRLRAARLLPWPAHPVLRVRFHFLEQLKHIRTRIRLPEYLRDAAGAEILPADEFAARLPELRANAAAELEQAMTSVGRDTLRDAAFPEHAWRIRELDTRRRELARDPATRPEAAALWDQQKVEETRLLESMVGRLLRNLHVLNAGYWDSRGALLPWAVALGGRAFYDKLLDEAEITEENGAEGL